MGRKIAVIGVAVLIVMSAFVFSAMMNSGEAESGTKKVEESIPFVQTQVVTIDTESIDILSYGRVIPNRKLMLYSEVPGKIQTTRKPFKVGVSYKAGEPILSIDSRELEFQLKTQKAEMLALLTGIMADIKLDYKSEFDKWNSYLIDFDIEDKLKPLPETSNEQLKMFLSTRNVFKQYYSIKNSEVKLDKYVISSPYSGTLTATLAEPGMIVSPGQKLGEFSSAGGFEVEIGLSDIDLGYVSAGTSVVFTDEQTGKQWDGIITRIANNVEQQSQTIKAFASVKSQGIKEGMYLTVQIKGRNIAAVEKIERNAIVDNNSLFFINDGKLDKKQVEIVHKGVDFAYVSGLSEGDTIILLPPSNLPLGTKVQSMPEDNSFNKALESDNANEIDDAITAEDNAK